MELATAAISAGNRRSEIFCEVALAASEVLIMGVFDNLVGNFKCVRCGAVSEGWIQTKLFQPRLRQLHVGDSDYVDVEGELPLHPWKEPWWHQEAPLVLIVGDWDCGQCGLNSQWAKLSLTVRRTDHGPFGTIQSLETFVPTTSSAFDDVHFIEFELAAMSGLWGQPFNFLDGKAAWLAHSIDQRCALVVAGYKTWCRDAAHADIGD